MSSGRQADAARGAAKFVRRQGFGVLIECGRSRSNREVLDISRQQHGVYAEAE